MSSACICVGQYQIPAVSAYLSAVGRSPAPQPHPFYAAGVLAAAVPLDGGRHAAASPGPSDLREALAQPSRLAQQEQLLAKQRVQQMVPLIAGVRPAPAVDACRSPVGLGQHRMPFTIPEPRSMSASRAEPKAAPPQSTPPEPPLQRLPPPPSSGCDLIVGHSADLGGSFAAGRLEPPRSAAAMLSSTFNPVDLVIAQLQHHHQQQQQHPVDLGVLHRFHPVARPGLDAVRVPPPSTAAYSPALPGVMAPLSTPLGHSTSVTNCVSGRDSPLVSSTSTLGDLQNEAVIMTTTKVLEVHANTLHTNFCLRLKATIGINSLR